MCIRCTLTVPGVIDSVSNFVEHPDLVAQRVCQLASVVGRERVIAVFSWREHKRPYPIAGSRQVFHAAHVAELA